MSHCFSLRAQTLIYVCRSNQDLREIFPPMVFPTYSFFPPRWRGSCKASLLPHSAHLSRGKERHSTRLRHSQRHRQAAQFQKGQCNFSEHKPQKRAEKNFPKSPWWTHALWTHRLHFDLVILLIMWSHQRPIWSGCSPLEPARYFPPNTWTCFSLHAIFFAHYRAHSGPVLG